MIRTTWWRLFKDRGLSRPWESSTFHITGNLRTWSPSLGVLWKCFRKGSFLNWLFPLHLFCNLILKNITLKSVLFGTINFIQCRQAGRAAPNVLLYKNRSRIRATLLYMCDSGVPILYHEPKSIPWVFSIIWVPVYTMSPCQYHESMSIPWVQ